MIDVVFTIDYEIYGNGEGSLRDLVYEPALKLKKIFNKWRSRFVVFVEAAELEMIESKGTDEAINQVKQQVLDFYNSGYELGLHIHPQWYNARYQDGRWQPDYREYNLCALPKDRMNEVLDRSIGYLRKLVKFSNFIPLSFRAGNWLLQPTSILSMLLVQRGIRVDSSVFKGGLQRNHNLDYRRALRNGYYWPFLEDVNVPSEQGKLLEVPTYTRMVPLWKLLTGKRLNLNRKSPPTERSSKERILRLFDFARLRHPLKLDFCRMTLEELTLMLRTEIQKDRKNPMIYRPIVAIGHTKDLMDLETVDALLSFLYDNGLNITGFHEVYSKAQAFRNQVI